MIVILLGFSTLALFNNRVSYKYEVDLYETGINITNRSISKEDKMKTERIKTTLNKHYKYIKIFTAFIAFLLTLLTYKDIRKYNLRN